MIKLNVGCNFSMELLKGVITLNKKYRHNNIQVTEFYGSLKRSVSHIPTARPDSRIPDMKEQQLREFIKECNIHNIRFNYTANSPSTADWINQTKESFNIMLEMLDSLGVDIITIAHPIPAIEYSKEFPLELSTIMEIDDINVIDYYINYANLYRISKICLSIKRNRDIGFLQKVFKYFPHIELLANEFCTYAGFPCQGILRAGCYETHTLQGNKYGSYNNYPLGWCDKSREENPVAWLTARVIFPWDIPRYTSEIGCNKFKISGRTQSTERILHTIEAYLSFGEVMNDNVLELWGHIKEGKTFDADQSSPMFMSANKLKKLDFVGKRWLNNPGFECNKNLCRNCRYCNEAFKKIREDK